MTKSRTRSIYLPETVLKTLKSTAEAKDRSINWLIARAVDEYLERHTEKVKE